MPYKSDAQRRFFHTDTARRKGISADTVKEFDQASKGRDLPERSSQMQRRNSPAVRGLREHLTKRG